MSDKQYTAEEIRAVVEGARYLVLAVDYWNECVEKIEGRVLDTGMPNALEECRAALAALEDQGLHIDPADLGQPEPGKEGKHE